MNPKRNKSRIENERKGRKVIPFPAHYNSMIKDREWLQPEDLELDLPKYGQPVPPGDLKE